MPYQKVFTLQQDKRVHSSLIDWADKTYFGQTEIVDLANIETQYLALFPSTDRFEAQVGGELAITPWNTFTTNTGLYWWIASKQAGAADQYLSLDSGTAPSDFADRAEVLHFPPGVAGDQDAGYIYGEPIVYTADATFTKANFPGVRALIIECVAGGGGSGGGANPAAGQSSSGGAGGGGGYSKSFVLITDVDTTEAIQVGQGGAGGAAGNNAGSPGEDSFFDTISGEVRAKGGGAGQGSASYAPLSGVPGSPGSGGALAGASGNLLMLQGGDGITGFALANNRLIASAGGGSFYSSNQSRSMIGTGNTNGSAGKLYGGGASGGGSSAAAGTHAGAAGADGLVLVTLLY